MKRGLVMLNGNPPGKRLLRSLVQQADVVVAADGGANALVQAGIVPQAVIGDLDSLDRAALEKVRRVQIVREDGQEDTDFEKTLRWILRNTDARDIIFTGGMSGELDHMVTHLSVACKYARRARLRQVEDTAYVHYITDRLELSVKTGTEISLMGVGRAEGVRTEGLQWELHGETLALGVRDGLHNRATNGTVAISVRDGCVVAIMRKTKGEAFRW